MDKLTYIAPAGQIRLGLVDPLINTEPCPITIEGFALPGHTDNHGHVYTAGFDIISLKVARSTEFVSTHALVYADVGQELHWRSVPQAVQWADEQV